MASLTHMALAVLKVLAHGGLELRVEDHLTFISNCKAGNHNLNFELPSKTNQERK